MQDDLVTIDVTASYPEKKLVLQDFMDVEYIPLETTDDILCAGSVWAVSENLILATNFNQDGNIFLFDRESGKALRKINHKGQSGEEYTSALGFILDEENNELYVSDTYGRKIFVYDLEGNFKRRLSWEDDFMFSEIFDFNQEYLIAHDVLNENSTSPRSKQAFMLLSKQNGSITKTIQIPFKDKKSIIIRTPVDDSGMFTLMPLQLHIRLYLILMILCWRNILLIQFINIRLTGQWSRLLQERHPSRL